MGTVRGEKGAKESFVTIRISTISLEPVKIGDSQQRSGRLKPVHQRHSIGGSPMRGHSFSRGHSRHRGRRAMQMRRP